ncbi:MAG TPA: hypothetical protein VI685_17260 [Candidatus Angelobacter sp.]
MPELLAYDLKTAQITREIVCGASRFIGDPAYDSAFHLKQPGGSVILSVN